MLKIVGSADKASAVAAWCQENLGTRWGMNMSPHRWDSWNFRIDDPVMLNVAILKFSK